MANRNMNMLRIIFQGTHATGGNAFTSTTAHEQTFHDLLHVPKLSKCVSIERGNLIECTEISNMFRYNQHRFFTVWGNQL